jgi:hypothetical protein
MVIQLRLFDADHLHPVWVMIFTLSEPDSLPKAATDDSSEYVQAVVNAAPTDVSAVRPNEQAPVPEHIPPLQPEKAEPLDGVALNVMTVFALNNAEHIVPQLILLPALFTTPLPSPVFDTPSVNCLTPVWVIV